MSAIQLARQRASSYRASGPSVLRWDGRVAECGGFENRFAREGNGGSNPSPTAMMSQLIYLQ